VTQGATQTGHLLVVDDNARARQSLADVMQAVGHSVVACGSGSEALQQAAASDFDVIITDLMMPGMDGIELIKALAAQGCESQIIMVTAHGTIDTAVTAMRHGAFDYLEKPLRMDEVESLVNRALRDGPVIGKRSTVPSGENGGVVMLGSSPAMQRLRAQIERAAPTNETILITGESGVGKELVANSIHLASKRAAGPMVSLNCPALSPQLMESELFGHERGAFTSADAPREGRFELADGGTILLDEVTEISLPLQAKLLRVLQEKTYERVGSSQTLSANVRMLAATNRNLEDEVKAGNFRQDLYFRLNVIPLEVPPLRERREDITLLAEHFLQAAAVRMERLPCELSADAKLKLETYSWPGNVRELENIMTRMTVLSVDGNITGRELGRWLSGSDDVPANESEAAPQVGTSLHDMERQLIEATLEHFDGHRQKTAVALGIGVRTLTNKLRSYGYAPRSSFAAKSA
jgi:DNA-binding NtrC family response regulator